MDPSSGTITAVKLLSLRRPRYSKHIDLLWKSPRWTRNRARRQSIAAHKHLQRGWEALLGRKSRTFPWDLKGQKWEIHQWFVDTRGGGSHKIGTGCYGWPQESSDSYFCFTQWAIQTPCDPYSRSLWPTFPIPLVGEGAGETGMKSILFGEEDFSDLSKSLSLWEHKSISLVACVERGSQRSWAVLSKEKPSGEPATPLKLPLLLLLLHSLVKWIEILNICKEITRLKLSSHDWLICIAVCTSLKHKKGHQCGSRRREATSRERLNHTYLSWAVSLFIRSTPSSWGRGRINAFSA